MKVKMVDDKKSRLTKLAIGTVMLLVGIVMGVIGVFAFLILDQPSPEELEAIMLQDSLKYITTEQQRLGIDCNEFNTSIRDFLQKDIKPVLKVHQPGRNWYKDIGTDVRKRMENLRNNYSSCGMLYSEAQRAKWDGLKGFAYTIEFNTDLVVLNTLIGLEWCDQHDAECLNQYFRDLQDTVTKIEKHSTPK